MVGAALTGAGVAKEGPSRVTRMARLVRTRIRDLLMGFIFSLLFDALYEVILIGKNYSIAGSLMVKKQWTL
jgi:hypothetical protein